MDLKVIIFFVAVAFLVSLVVYFRTKKIFVPVVIFSILSNVVLHGNVNYRFAAYYNVFWLFNFVRNIWPLINLVLFIILIIYFIKNAKNKKK